MTRRFWTLLATTGAIALSSLILGKEPAQSQTNSGFYCGVAEGLPATIYRNSDGASEPWIIWRSDFFTDAGYNPQERCQQVSTRLETYRRNNQLDYAVLGRMNGENVICASIQPVALERNCQNLIFTLKPGQDAVRTLNTFLAWRAGEAGLSSLYESAAPQYIDLRSRLRGGGGAAPAPANAQPVTPQPSQSPGGMRRL